MVKEYAVAGNRLYSFSVPDHKINWIQNTKYSCTSPHVNWKIPLFLLERMTTRMDNLKKKRKKSPFWHSL